MTLSTPRAVIPGEVAAVGVTYQPGFLQPELADSCLQHCLHELPWQQEVVKMFGKSHTAPRLSCAIGDDGCNYRYNGSQSEPIRFTQVLHKIRLECSERLNVPFNFVLATLYRDGSDYVGWHADDERDLVSEQVIANLSLGSTRTFKVKSKEGTLLNSIETTHGSLLLMVGESQRRSKHMLTKTRKAVGPRVVLSFREVIT